MKRSLGILTGVFLYMHCSVGSAVESVDCGVTFSSHSSAAEQRDKIWEVIDSALSHAVGQKWLDPELVDPLEDLFDSHESWFGSQSNLLAFKRRVMQFGGEIFPMLSKDMLHTEEDYSINDSILFSLIVRPTIKDWVWNHSIEGRTKLQNDGVDPYKLMNINDPGVVLWVLNKAISGPKPLIKRSSIDDKIRYLTGWSSKDIESSEVLGQIFADEITEALKVPLTKISRQKSYTERQKQIANKLHEALVGESNDFRMILARRSLGSFKNGQCSGDCTRPGRENFWTVGTLLSSFENLELHYFHKKEFFARIVVAIGFREGEPAVYVHAVEFSPKVKHKRSRMYANRFDYFSRFMRDAYRFFKRAGIDRLLLTTVSASDGYDEAVNSFIKTYGMDLSTDNFLEFDILTRQESSHNILGRQLNIKSKSIPIYFQGWLGPFNFANSPSVDLANSYREESEVTISGGYSISRIRLQKAAHIFMEYVENNSFYLKKQIEPVMSDLYEVYNQAQANDISEIDFISQSKSILTRLNSLVFNRSREEVINKLRFDQVSLDLIEKELKEFDRAFNPSGSETDDHSSDEYDGLIGVAIKQMSYLLGSAKYRDEIMAKLKQVKFSDDDIKALLADIHSVLPYARTATNNLDVTDETSFLIEGIEIRGQ